MSYWAAAQVRTNETARAVRNITRQGFQVYAPLCRPSRRSAKIVPLFPGYLFVCIVDRWHCLLGTYGVIDVLRAGDAPARVREHEIERMRDQEDKSGIIVLPLTKFQPGEKVRVTRGPLRDHVGLIHAGMTAKQRVAVLFTMFQQETQIDMHERDLTAV